MLNNVNPINQGVSIKLYLLHESKNAYNTYFSDGFRSIGFDIGANKNDKNSIRYQGRTIQPVGAQCFAASC